MSNVMTADSATARHWQPGWSLVTKLLVVVAAACMLIFLGLVVFSVTMYQREKASGVDALVHRTGSLAASLRQVDEASRQAATQSFSILSDRLPTMLIKLQPMNEGFQLHYAGMPLEGDTAPVDAFTQMTGGVATIFQREGDDFRRITTSLKKEDGSRAVNTLLDRKHPAYASMVAGKPYLGAAVLFGKMYMTRYEPVVDDGKTIGILFIGHDMSSQMGAVKQSFQASGTDTTATLAVELREGPRLGLTVGTGVPDKLDTTDALLTKLKAEVGAGRTSGVISDLPLTNVLKGSGAAHVGWTYFEPWGWAVLQAQRESDTIAHTVKDLILLWTLIAGGAVIAAISVLVAIRKMVLFPLQDVLKAVRQLSNNDYSQPLVTSSKDELGQFIAALEVTRRQLSANMRQMEQSAADIDAVAKEVAKGNIELGGRTEAAASNLQRTSTGMQQLTDTVQQSADAARQANQLATTAAEVAERGGQAVSQVVTTMDAINQSSRKIADIIGVIDSIAFQTNILALNAAVEAARAGEAGRGFAVVASEVRSLAGRSAQAAKEIKDLITASVNSVQSGSDQVHAAGQTMSEIVASVQRVTDVIGEITAAAAEQSSGISRMNVSVGEMDQMTQQNAALVDQVAAAADNLTHQTMRLQEALARYKTGNDGVADSELATRALSSASTDVPTARRISASAPAAPKLSAPPAPPKVSATKALPTPRRHADADAPRLPHQAGNAGTKSSPTPAQTPSPVSAKTTGAAAAKAIGAPTAPVKASTPAAPTLPAKTVGTKAPSAAQPTVKSAPPAATAARPASTAARKAVPKPSASADGDWETF